MDEHRRVELDCGVPELVEGNLAQIDAFHIGGDHQTGSAELAHGVFGLARRGRGVRQRHGSKQREFAGVLAAQFGQAFVEQPVPARADRARQAIGEDVGPDREHLAGDALRRHAGKALVHRFDQFGKERPNFQPIVEVQRALRRRLDQRYAKIARSLFERIDDSVRHVMRMHVDWHCSPFSAVDPQSS